MSESKMISSEPPPPRREDNGPGKNGGRSAAV
jgi:hypothetical protein